METHGKKIINNSIFNFINISGVFLIGFIARRYLALSLGDEILGLNSLYLNIIDMLNLAELGIGVAVQYQLYDPLVKGENARTADILYIAQKLYNIIGFLILFVGICLMFILRYFIKDNPFTDQFILFSFFISVLGVSTGYLLSKGRLYFYANEQSGIVNVVDLMLRLLTTTIAILSLLLYKNYYIYLLSISSYVFLSNIVLQFIFKKRFPYAVIDAGNHNAIKHELFVNLKSIVPTKITNYIYNSTDNIIISKLLGLTAVAIYSNYMVVINAIMSFEYALGNIVFASFGKMIKEEIDEEKIYEYYLIFQYVQFLFACFGSVGMMLMIKPVITLWLGKAYEISTLCFVLLIIEFFIHSMYQASNIMFIATGRFKKDRYITIASALLNLSISILLGIIIGMEGVIIGTVVTDIYIWFVRSYEIVKKTYKQSMTLYCLKTVKYIIITLCAIVCSNYFMSLISVNSDLSRVVFGLIITLGCSGFACYVGTFWSKEFKQGLGILKNIIGRNSL